MSVTEAGRPRLSGKGFMTICANLWIPGLGFALGKMWRRALGWFGVSVVLTAATLLALSVPRLVPALIVLFPVSVIASLWLLIDGYVRGLRATSMKPTQPALRFLAAIGFLVLWRLASPALHIAYYVHDHVVEAFKMPTPAMSPTIQPGDRFFAHKRLGDVRRWDVVVIVPPPDPMEPPGLHPKYVERVVGLPGELVELFGDDVHINGAAVALPPGLPPYQSNPPGGPRIGCRGNPIRLGRDEYYVLGDNSPISGDARYWRIPVPRHQSGALPAENIVGVVTWTYWPPAHWKRLSR